MGLAFSPPDLSALDPRRLGFELRRDDFSIQISSPADRRFWLRIDTDQRRFLSITDFKASETAMDSCGRLLAWALLTTGLRPPVEFVFADVAPTAGTHPSVEARAQAEFATILAASRVAADLLDSPVSSASLAPGRRGIDARVGIG